MSSLSAHQLKESARNCDLDAALVEAKERYVAARPNSARIHATARGVLPGGNTRSVLFYKPFPTAMARGESCFLEDVDGNSYLDLCGEYSAGLFGHTEPRIQASLHAAIDRGLNFAAVGEQEGKLAACLCARFPSVDRVRFTNSGTEANMMSLGVARAFSGRSGVLGFFGGYHGGLMGFTSGGSIINAPIPITLVDFNNGQQAAAALRAGKKDIGAVIVEPMMGSGGCIPASREFLNELRTVTKEVGAVLVFDEVMTSRHSAGGLQKLFDITPDLSTFGKYMAGGMSFGAFGGRSDIMELFDGHRPGTLFHSGTFNNNVMSMSAGIVAMGEIFDAVTADAHFARGERLRNRLNEVCKQHKVPMHFSGLGSMMQPHFRQGPIVRPYIASVTEDSLRELFFFDMLAAGIYLARRGMASLSLPIGDSECQRFVSAVDEYCTSRRALFPTA